MKITSSQFKNKTMIPRKYTCEGDDINPPLKIIDIPDKTESLVLILDDPDAPINTWTHWILYDISPITYIEENSVPGKQVMNDFDKKNYCGPCPPSGVHRYFFRLYALDKKINSTRIDDRDDIEKELKGHIIATDELIGLYRKET